VSLVLHPQIIANLPILEKGLVGLDDLENSRHTISEAIGSCPSIRIPFLLAGEVSHVITILDGSVFYTFDYQELN